MKAVAVTIDVETDWGGRLSVGPGNCQGIEEGIPYLLHLLDELKIKATFFIDYFAVKKWGVDIFHIVNEKIASKGHDIQLHMHPHIMGGKSYLWQYEKQEQEKLIDEAISYFEKFNGRLKYKTKAFFFNN